MYTMWDHGSIIILLLWIQCCVSFGLLYNISPLILVLCQQYQFLVSGTSFIRFATTPSSLDVTLLVIWMSHHEFSFQLVFLHTGNIPVHLILMGFISQATGDYKFYRSPTKTPASLVIFTHSHLLYIYARMHTHTHTYTHTCTHNNNLGNNVYCQGILFSKWILSGVCRQVVLFSQSIFKMIQDAIFAVMLQITWTHYCLGYQGIQTCEASTSIVEATINSSL